MSLEKFYPLKNIRGVQNQSNMNEIVFSWEKSVSDKVASFVWIFSKIEGQPRIINYSKCYGQRISVNYPYLPIHTSEVNKMQFLIFVTENANYQPTKTELDQMSTKQQYLCDVYCGIGKVECCWQMKNQKISLIINSEKGIPEGILFYEYPYKNMIFRIDIPGRINPGENRYEGIIFPNMEILPYVHINAIVQNVLISESIRENGRLGGFIRNMFGH